MSRMVPVAEGAEAFVELLNANGVDYIFLNPGTDTPSIQEALVKLRAQGKRTPQVILSLHETVAMAAAHGHFMVSGRPQVVLVHTGIGTQQVGGALHDAQCGHAGIIFCAGKAPLPYEEDRRCGRFGEIHWLQEQYDQAGIVRDFVKWECELRSNESIHTVVQRAFRMAASEPCGPVYLVLPPHVLLEKITGVIIPDTERYAPPATPQADAASLEAAAELLLKAERPLIILGDAGRRPQVVAPLVTLAETLGARVITSLFRMNFPTTHPLCSGEISPGPYLKDADVILVIDRDVPYVPSQAKPAPGAKIIHISLDPIKPHIPLWDFPADVLIEADSGKAVPALNEMLTQKMTPRQRTRSAARFREIEKENRVLREQWRRQATDAAAGTPIAPDWLGYCINEIIDDDTVILNEAVTNSGVLVRQIHLSQPGAMYRSGGTSLGWALGAAMGAKLAAPEKTVITLTGDGAFLFGCPIESLWAAGKYRAPFLSVVFNNQRYNSPANALRRAYGRESFSEKTGDWAGMDIKPPLELGTIAQACGAYGKTVTDPADLLRELREALEAVRAGQPAVLDVRVK